MIDRSRIGWRSAPTVVPIDAWRVKLFCEAIGESDPVYWDLQAARAAGLSACPVPPTFLKAVEGEHFSSATLLQMLQVPVGGVLHAEQQFHYFAAVHVGDRVEVSRSVEQIFDKKDGALTFIVVDTRYAVGERPAASSRQTILVRNAKSTA